MEALAEDDDPRLRVDFVWGPVWGDAGSSSTQLDAHQPLSEDPRVRVWFDDGLQLHNALAEYTDEAAPLIDQYFVYAPGGTWDGDHPPDPEYVEYGHVSFDEDGFLDQMRDRLPDCEEVVEAE